jgi:hypothetical protein
MIAASIFDHPAILLLIVFIALVRWLVSKAKSQTQSPQSPPPSPPPSQPIRRGGETQTEEERVRRFLEALGQPAGTTPPKVAPRRQIRPDVFSPLPPLKTKPPPLPQEATPPPLPIENRSWQPASPPTATAFEVQEIARQTSSAPPPARRSPAAVRFDPRIKLGNPQDLRSAIVLREIFGPPRSLQPFDLTS